MQQPLQLLATLAVILLGKSIAAFLIIRAFKHPTGTALVVSASLAQIGEFSFILATLGVDLAILPEAGRDLVIAGAIISIVLNPFVFMFAMNLATGKAKPEAPAETDLVPCNLSGHAVIVGYGRVGETIVEGLRKDGHAVLVVDDRPERVDRARTQGIEALLGNGAEPDVLKATNIVNARMLFVAIPSVFEAGQIIAKARAANAVLRIVARSHSDEEVVHLRAQGADEIVMGERELALAMLERLQGAANAQPPAA
jgi:CPA2 family monovalent cation:H+ antiporter-2